MIGFLHSLDWNCFTSELPLSGKKSLELGTGTEAIVGDDAKSLSGRAAPCINRIGIKGGIHGDSQNRRKLQLE